MIGARLDGYEIEALLGRGAMGTVYRARQLSLDRPVAVKVLHAHLSADAAFVDRFRREARAIAKLAHPHIVHILGIGEHAGAHYYAMELLAGDTVETRLRRVGRFPLKAAARILVQACRGVHAAHEAGIVHRDLKPENLAFDQDGRVKVMDFGVARQHWAEDTLRSGAGRLIGTPAFMSPEQAAGRPGSPASDIYSLGVVFYELLTGALPFTHDDLFLLLQLQQWEEPPAPRTLRADLPIGVEEIILKMLAKAPAERYAACSEVVADLRAVGSGRPAESSARGTRTTGAVGMAAAGPAAGPAAPAADPAAPEAVDPFTALALVCYERLVEQARRRRVTLHLRAGAVLRGSAGHFAGDHAVLTIPEVGEVGLPVEVLAPEPYRRALDEAALRRQSQQWAEAFLPRWQTAHPGAVDWTGQMLADARAALPDPAPEAHPPELHALVEAWRARRAAQQDLEHLEHGGTQSASGTVLLDVEESFPDRVLLRTGKAVACRVLEEKPNSLWVNRADGRRVRLPRNEVRCVLKNAPVEGAPRPPGAEGADRVTLHSGRVIPCTILREAHERLTVRKADGAEARLAFTEIQCAEWGAAGEAAAQGDAAARHAAAQQRVADADAAYRDAVAALVACLATDAA